MVMCSEPMTRAPASGLAFAYLARTAIRPGISCSARRISERPSTARLRSRTLNGSRPAALAAAKGWVISRVAGMSRLNSFAQWCGRAAEEPRTPGVERGIVPQQRYSDGAIAHDDGRVASDPSRATAFAFNSQTHVSPPPALRQTTSDLPSPSVVRDLGDAP